MAAESSRVADREPVAIVGIGCRFPGGVVDRANFWRLLIDGIDAIGEIPRDRIDVEQFYDSTPATPGRIMTRWGGFLTGLQEFDAAFFGIAPREAERMDPQQRLMLETAWEALEDAGLDIRGLDGSLTGVFIGQWLSDFEGRLFADPAATDFYMTTGSGRYSTSGRISYALGLRGASLTIDTACSSSLAAVHLAVQSIRSGDSTIALAGGVNVILQPHITIAYSQSRMMSPDGRCKFGDASGDGYVRSEGAGLIVLKPLSRAVGDGDRIYAVIRGSVVNNDGRSSGSMGTPSRVGQEELLRRAYDAAGVEPGRVGYVEAHGTGTRVGDPIELGALGAVLREGRPRGELALVGSVKTNIGHTEGAAGIAGLIKVALALHHGVIPPSLHCRQPNPTIPWTELPVAIARETTTWPRTAERLRVAGVSAFGIAGTNAHAVIEEAPALPIPDRANGRRACAMLPISARSDEALRALASRYAELVESATVDVADICWSAATRRTPLEHRAVFAATDRSVLAEALRRFAAGEPAAAQGMVVGPQRPKVVFAAPGQGGQWVGMARELAAVEPIFRAALERAERAISRWADWRLLEQLHLAPESPGYRLDDIDVIQPALVALEIAYAELLQSRGVEPDAVVGHSMGEVAAAYLAGVIDLDQAMRVICLRSALMRRTSGQGAMALVDLSMTEAQARIAAVADRVTVAVSNSPRSCVLSGDAQTVRQQVAQLEREGIFCRVIKVDVASHSPQMDAAATELAATLDPLATTAVAVAIYSTVLGRSAAGDEFGASYWGRNLRQPVRFSETIEQLLRDGATVFVELGPHPILLPSIQQTAGAAGVPATTIAVADRNQSEVTAIDLAIGALWVSGYPVDWRKAMPAGGRVVDLPLYPWQRERHWLDAAEIVPVATTGRRRPRSLDDEESGWLHQLEWADAPMLPLAAVSNAAGKWLIVCERDRTEITDAFLARGCAVETARLESLEAVVDKSRLANEVLAGIVLCAGAAADAAYLPIRGLQAIVNGDWKLQPRLWCVTTGGQPVTTGARVSVEQAALWGAGRVIAEEHPDIWGGLIDLDPQAAAASADLLVRHLVAFDGETQVAFRGERRFALRIASIQHQTRPAPFAWRPDSSYLITGGLGDIGLQVASAMAANGARRLILLGRTPLPPRASWSSFSPDSAIGKRVAGVRGLESSGVAVHVATVDLTDESCVREFLTQFAAEGWPPIRGVVHAAAALDNHLVAKMDRASFDRVVQPKLGAAQLLDRLLPDLDLFVTFSSIVGYLGQTGEANYAAANAGLDALACDRHARGLPAISIAWAAWSKTGFASGEGGERVAAELGRQGIQTFAPDRGVSIFNWLTTHELPAVAVLPIDWAAFRRARNGRGLPLYRDLVSGGSSAGANSEDLTQRLTRAAVGERRQLLESVVRESVGGVLKIAPARLDVRKAFGSMGLTSLMALELRNRLEALLGRSFSASLAWNYPTVSALVDYLASEASTFGGASAPVVAASLPAAEVTKLLALSDEEAALALRRGRSRRDP